MDISIQYPSRIIIAAQSSELRAQPAHESEALGKNLPNCYDERGVLSRCEIEIRSQF